MYCWKCGAANDDNNFRCVKCNEVIQQAPAEVAPAEDIGQDAGMRLLLPVGRSPWAIAAGYVALGSLLIWPAALIAIVLSIIAIIDIKRHPKKHGMGRAIFGLVVGGLVTAGLIVVVALTVLRIG